MQQINIITKGTYITRNSITKVKAIKFLSYLYLRKAYLIRHAIYFLYKFNYFSIILFRCFVGDDEAMTVEDCISRDRRNPVYDPHETSRSVSEMKEWVCSKMAKPDGRIIRDCFRLYTGGEAFKVCYSSTQDGDTCLCSRELCNGSTSTTRQSTNLTFQRIIRSSGTLISCLLLLMFFKSYCQTTTTCQSYCVKRMTCGRHKNLRERIS